MSKVKQGLTKKVGSRRRGFFTLSTDMRKLPAGLIFENEAALCPGGGPFQSPLDPRERGFSRFSRHVRPVLRHVKKLGRKPLDFENVAGYWLISGIVKDVFERSDPCAFEFWRCDLIVEDDIAVESWLCDVVRIVDALDEQQSDMQIMQGHRKIYYLGGSIRLVFNEKKVGKSHIFRMAHIEQRVIADDTLRNNCKAAKIKGMMFRDAINTRVEKKAL